MGAPGEDLLLSPAARREFPFSVECKNVEKLNIWQAIDQCVEYAGEHTPLVLFKKNGRQPYAAMPMDKLLELITDYNRLKNEANKSTD